MATLQQRDQRDDPTSSVLLTETAQALHRLFDAVYSEGDLSVVERVVTADVRGYCTGTESTYRGLSGLKAHAARLRATFHGLTFEVNEVHRTPEGVVVGLTATGRFERAFGGIRPSCRMGAVGEEPGGPLVTMAGTVAGEVTDGQLSELAFDWDLEALRAQR